MSFYDNQNNEIINVTLKNSRGSKTAPLTTTEQVLAHDIFNSSNPDKRLDWVLSDIYSVASSARCEAFSAYDLANNAYKNADRAYDLANTNSEYLSDVKVIFKALAGTMYNDAGEGMGCIDGGNPTVPELGFEIGQAYDQANTAYSLAKDAYLIAGSIYNRASKKAADGYNAGTYLLKATIDSDNNITFTWVNEADYKNA